MNDLLMPRYKVIADYPEMPFSLNQIIDINTNWLGEASYEWADYDGMRRVYQTELNQYPHLFKPLSWWEDRDFNDMPEYIKAKERDGSYVLYKITGWNFGEYTTGYFENGVPISMEENDILPATEEEYTQYINSKL